MSIKKILIREQTKRRTGCMVDIILATVLFVLAMIFIYQAIQEPENATLYSFLGGCNLVIICLYYDNK